MTLEIDIDREDDGRWIAEVRSLPGVMAYGASESEARGKVRALALRVLADRIEHDEAIAYRLGDPARKRHEPHQPTLT